MDKFMLNMYNYLNGYLERNHSNISKLDREDIAQVAAQGGYDEYSENCDEIKALAVAVDICEKLVSDISEVSDKNMSVFVRFLPEDVLDNEELLRTVRLEIWEKLLDSSKKPFMYLLFTYLYYREGLPFKKIAMICGVSPARVSQVTKKFLRIIRSSRFVRQSLYSWAK